MENILENVISNNIDNRLSNSQNSFLESTFGKVIDSAVNLGIKALFPDFIENQVIDVKNVIMQDGVKAGINEAITNSIDLGKSIVGIFTGNFENLSQIQNAVKKGGLIDSVSEVIDKGLNLAVKSGLLDKSVSKVLNTGKKEVLKSVSNSIENTLSSQSVEIEKLNKACDKWQEAFDARDFTGMEKQIKKIDNQIDKIVPLETIIDKAREIKNLHTLIENNGMNFDLSTEQLSLAKLL